MPRIRKKTSKRGTTHQRTKIKHKAAESRKKAKREAKRNPEWKSKKPKDPGIPNNFPYKEQILAEVAEERRQAAEAKARRKEEKKLLREKQRKVEAGDESDESEVEDAEKADAEATADAFDGIKSLNVGTTSAKKEKGKAAAVVEEDEEEAAPALINPDLPTLKSVLDVADVVIQVLDARDPLPFRSAALEKVTAEKKGRKLLLVLNKIDTSPRESVAAWAGELRSSHPTVLFRSASHFLPDASSKGKQKAPATDAWGVDAVTKLLSEWAGEKEGSDPLTVAVVGLTNSGKSSFINSLLRKAAFPIYDLASSSSNQGPTTTVHAQETTLDLDGKQIRLIDTPGLSWQHDDSRTPEEIERIRARDILLRSRGKLDRLKDPLPAVKHIVSRAEQQDLMVFYNLPAFMKGDTTAFLSGVARANGFIKKGGLLDLQGAARLVLRDWNTGKFPRYTVPASTTGAVTPAVEDEAVLPRLPTRKDLRKTAGLVKLVPEAVDERNVELEAPWFSEESGDGESDEGDEDVEMDGVSGEEDEDEDDEEEDEDEDEDEDDELEEPEPVVVKGKRKRTSQPAAPTSKKVAFSAKNRPTPAAVSPSKAPLKSALKPSKQPAPKPSKQPAPPKGKPAPAKKAANVPSKKSAGSAGGKGEEYDFTKFF